MCVVQVQGRSNENLIMDEHLKRKSCHFDRMHDFINMRSIQIFDIDMLHSLLLKGITKVVNYIVKINKARLKLEHAQT